MNINKVKSLLGMAQKGRMLEIGRTAATILIKRKRAALIIVAMDGSEKLKKEIEFICRRNNVPIYIFSTKNELGEICGRDSVAVIGISDKHLGDGIKKALL